MRESRETDEVLVCVAQRLQSQLERQLTLVERLQVSGLDESLADLAELRTSVQRTLRGSENLLVLGGAQQGPRVRGPRTVGDVLADARAAVEDPSRIGLGPAPGAAFAPRAVAGVLALVTELLTHGLTVSSTLSRVDVTSRRAEDGGVTIEVGIDGSGPSPDEIDELNQRLGDRPIIDDIVGNRVGLFVAARLARRCGAGLRAQHPRAGTLSHGGLTLVVHCPPDLLDAADFAAPDAPRTTTNGHGSGNGRRNGHDTYSDTFRSDHDGRRDRAPADPAPPVERPRRPDPLFDPLPSVTARSPTTRPPALPQQLTAPVVPRQASPPSVSQPALPSRSAGRREPPAWNQSPTRPEARREPSSWLDEPLRSAEHSGADELFGPLTTSLRDRMREAGPTPIYEAVASAWFVEGDGAAGSGRRRTDTGSPPPDWSTPSDAEWRAASERAARPEPEQSSTAAGLPRRRPGTQMVAPPRHGTPVPPNGSRDREPERVRERLAVYQQGLDRGRHRADPGQ